MWDGTIFYLCWIVCAGDFLSRFLACMQPCSSSKCCRGYISVSNWSVAATCCRHCYKSINSMFKLGLNSTCCYRGFTTLSSCHTGEQIRQAWNTTHTHSTLHHHTYVEVHHKHLQHKTTQSLLGQSILWALSLTWQKIYNYTSHYMGHLCTGGYASTCSACLDTLCAV